jgi:nanoRNase/pAp phosphatase (c-di-AMP/oligoRNAs hydrolase)
VVVAKSSRVLIFGDPSWPAESLGKFFSDDNEQPVSVWVDGRGWVLNKSAVGRTKFVSTDTALSAAESLRFDDLEASQEPVAIIGFADSEISQQVVDALRSKRSNIKILQVGSKGTRSALSQTKRSVAWKDLLSAGLDQELQLLSLQDRVRDLRSFLKDAEEVAILLQDDPDPDGLAGALALRKVLGRNSQTAPIVSFGKITRPENVSMAKLLDIEVRQVVEADFDSFDKVVMLDCQPSFFRGRKVRADVVIDHHPAVPFPESCTPGFTEMREDLGSISTLMTGYLRAASITPSERLATALLYGIKSDTLMLNREVSELDLSAFVYLYPLTNGNTLRRIERPELPLAYLSSLGRALKTLSSVGGVTVLALPNVEREEWIPQAADFALQVEHSHWAVGCGVFEGKVVLSGRNCGYVQHCGDLFKKLFNQMGCAGGHRTMAKAIISQKEWTRSFGKGSASACKLPELVSRLIQEALEGMNTVSASLSEPTPVKGSVSRGFR